MKIKKLLALVLSLVMVAGLGVMPTVAEEAIELPVEESIIGNEDMQPAMVYCFGFHVWGDFVQIAPLPATATHCPRPRTMGTCITIALPLDIYN